jgi:hypothetical protein
MGRPKGSKNKPKAISVPVTVIEPVIPVYIPITAISLDEKKKIASNIKAEGIKTCNYYGLNEWPEEAMSKRINNILDAPDLETAIEASRRAVDRLQIHLLSLWGKGLIFGPTTPEALENRAKKAESLAKYLESIGNVDAAEKQRDRAERIREEIL